MIGIICAVVEEAEALKSVITNIKEEIIHNIKFYVGKLNNNDVVFVQSGIGKVNAAMTTTLLIEKFNVKEIVFSGVAGSVNENLKIGDIVIGVDVVQHDMDVTEFGYEKGQIPQMDTYSFFGEKSIVDKVKNLKIENINLFFGRIITGDQFISGKEVKTKMGVDFRALCVDMESGAVAQVCYLMKVPFLIIRSISDSITDESTMEYNEFVKLAANNSKEILKRLYV